MQTTSSRRRAENLPADLTSFIGRQTEIVDVQRLLSTSRLVSLVGPGGVGKTRLALKVAAELRRAFVDGGWFVELADVRDGSLLAQTILDALRVIDSSHRSPYEVLTHRVRDQRMLLILDNCEQLLEESASLVADLLREAPELRVITTTRQPLRVEGERIHLVAPLDAPDPRMPLAAGAATQYAAVALFVERARAVVPDFTLTRDNEAVIAQLCQRLEGIPLAIELAAVSLRVHSVGDVARGLDQRLDLVTTGPRTAPARQQTLEATISWSFELCTPLEQALWARCSVFASHFDRRAAELICTFDDLPPESVLRVVAGLVDKSVLLRVEHGGMIRFCMSDMIRHYGLTKLREAGLEDDLRERHLAHFSGLVDDAAAGSSGPQQEGWLLSLERDQANLRAALDYALSRSGKSQQGMRLASTAWFYWIACGHLLEGRHWLDRALFADVRPTRTRVLALWTNAFVAILQGDLEIGEDLVAEALHLAAELDDATGQAYGTHIRGLAAVFSGDLTLAAELLDDAHERYVALGLVTGLPVLLGVHRGLAYLLDDDLGRATTMIEATRTICLAHGERWVLSYALQAAAFAEFLRDDLSATTTLVFESLASKRVFHDTLGIAIGLDLLGWVAAAEGRDERAATLLGAAHRGWDGVGEPVFGSKNFAARRARAEGAVRRSAGDAAYDDCFARGATFDLDQAVAYALEESEPIARDVEPSDQAAGLTRREAEVAELVGRGLSNKEIAASLVISQRTAEGHVQRILTKCGFTSRAQVAAWLAQQRALIPTQR